MENRVLSYFLMIAREESITKAAERLHITQPTLSRQIAQMEEEYGVKLLDRSGRRVSLTPAGILLRRRAEEILSLVHQTERELEESDALMEGTVRVAGGDLAANYDFIQLIKEFRAMYPKVGFDYFAAVSTEIKERINQGLTDVGLLVDSYEFEKYEYLPIGEPRKNGIYMPIDDPLAEKETIHPKDLEGKTIILASRQDLNAKFKSWAKDSLQTYDLGLSVSLPTNKAIMVECGMGYFVASEGVLPMMDTRKICYRPLEPDITIHTMLAWRRNQPFSLAAGTFIKFLKERLK